MLLAFPNTWISVLEELPRTAVLSFLILVCKCIVFWSPFQKDLSLMIALLFCPKCIKWIFFLCVTFKGYFLNLFRLLKLICNVKFCIPNFLLTSHLDSVSWLGCLPDIKFSFRILVGNTSSGASLPLARCVLLGRLINLLVSWVSLLWMGIVKVFKELASHTWYEDCLHQTVLGMS